MTPLVDSPWSAHIYLFVRFYFSFFYYILFLFFNAEWERSTLQDCGSDASPSIGQCWYFNVCDSTTVLANISWLLAIASINQFRCPDKIFNWFISLLRIFQVISKSPSLNLAYWTMSFYAIPANSPDSQCEHLRHQRYNSLFDSTPCPSSITRDRDRANSFAPSVFSKSKPSFRFLPISRRLTLLVLGRKEKATLPRWWASCDHVMTAAIT